MSGAENIINMLGKFAPITLKEMESVKLMNRTDTKYMFNLSQLTQILEKCIDSYKVVHINGSCTSTYQTLYYDTNNFELYHKHHSGKLNRYKIRIRTYKESKISFLEVKFKDNKGRTKKERISYADSGFNDTAAAFIESVTPYKASDLVPSVEILYTRITLVNRNYPERITIDLGLTLKKGNVTKAFDTLVIAEVKQDKNVPSVFSHLMKEMRIKEGSMSKYCIGVSNLVETVKANNFKENNRRINKTAA